MVSVECISIKLFISMHVSNISKFLCRTALDEEATWQDYYEEAVEYRQRHDNNNPQDGSDLKRWIDRQRNMAARVGLNLRDRRRVEILRQAGILQRTARNESNDSWQTNYSALLSYTTDFTELPPARRQGCESSPANDLRSWWKRQQNVTNRDEDQTQQLRDSGFLGSHHEVNWNIKYKFLIQYQQNGGEAETMHQNIIWYSTWAKGQRKRYFTGIMNEEQCDKLNEIDFDWNWGGNRDKILDQLVVSRDSERARSDNGRPNRYAHARIDFVKRAKLAGIDKEEVRRKLNYSPGHDNLDSIWDNL